MNKTSSGSKFSGLLAAVKDRETVTEDERPSPVETATPTMGARTETALTRGPGRPRGKRSDPSFEQVTAYISRQTHRDVKIALLTEGAGREFSELLEELLGEWLGKEV